MSRTWWFVLAAMALVTICMVVAMGAGYVAFKRGRGVTPLTSTVQAIARSPVVPAGSPTSKNATPASNEPSAGDACRIVSSHKISDGGDQDWSHANGLLAFDRRDSTGVYQLYVGLPDTGNYNCITCSPVPGAPLVDRHKIKPVWRPEGDFIVLEGEMADHPLVNRRASDRVSEIISNGSWSDLYATTPDGRSWFKLTATSSSGIDGVLLPTFSPDGSKLMWSRIVEHSSISNPFGVWKLMIADFVVTDGVPSLQNVRDITPPGARFIESHVFSPDGTHVMFAADINSSSPMSPDIWTLNLTTGQALNLTHDSAWDEHAVYTLDGKHIVYMTSLPYPGVLLKTDLMIMNVDGTDKQPFSHFNVEGYPEFVPGKSMPIRVSWNANGTRMAVTLQSGSSYPDRTLWMVGFAGACGT